MIMVIMGVKVVVTLVVMGAKVGSDSSDSGGDGDGD